MSTLPRQNGLSSSQGDDGRVKLIEGLQFMLAMHMAKEIRRKLLAEDYLTIEKYPDAQFTELLVLNNFKNFIKLDQD